MGAEFSGSSIHDADERNKNADNQAVQASGSYRDAFGELYERYYHAVHRYMQGRVGPDETFDLTADTFVKAFADVDNYSPDGAFLAWLYRIARNRAIDHFRKQEHGNELMPIEEAVEPQLFTRADIGDALTQLSQDQATVVELKFAEGLSNVEIAHILGKSEGAVKSLQHRAIANLRRVLGEDYMEE